MKLTKIFATLLAAAAIISCESSDSLLKQSEAFADSFSQGTNEITFDGSSKYKNFKGSLKFDRTIYVDAESGDDSNNGTSEKSAIKSLAQLAKMNIAQGDEILLKGGQRHMGTIELIGLNSNDKTIHVGSYGDQKATIDFKGYPAGVLVESSSNVVVTDLNITADGALSDKNYMERSEDANKRYRYGVYVDAHGAAVENIVVDNINVSKVYYFNEGDPKTPEARPCHEWSTNGETDYGWGIRGFSRTPGSSITNFTVTNCHVTEVSHTAIKINANPATPINNLWIEDCTVDNVGGPGAQFSAVNNSVMRRCKVTRIGSRLEPRMWGRGSGMWLVRSDNFLFEKCYFEGSEGVADCCGAHIDIGNKNVVVQYCVSKNNCGGFVEILGENENCSYRYNISINDGWRNPEDSAQDAYWMWKQETVKPNGEKVVNTIGTKGALITVNGHSNDYVGPYQSYIYNNTIVCTKTRKDGYTNPFVFEMTTSATGICVMNNLFWVPAKMGKTNSMFNIEHPRIYDPCVIDRSSGKKVIRQMTPEELKAQDFVVRNNLYQLYDPAFPGAENALPGVSDIEPLKGMTLTYTDANPLGGDPKFKGTISEEMTAEDLIPTDAAVINRGEVVTKLASDKTSYGVLPQLTMQSDFFGNPITTPIIGACVAQ